MKAINLKILFAVITAGVLCVILMSSQSSSSALAFDKPRGQDKAGQNCERIDTPESSTFGKCENVCKDKEVTRDAPNNRWVCKASKSAGTRPRVDRAPVGDKVLEPTATPNPKQPPRAGTKGGKAKTN